MNQQAQTEELALKLAFAKLFLKMNDPFKAALQLFPEDTSKAVKMAMEWPKDALVVAEMSTLQDEDETDGLEFLPSKAEYARQVWESANEENVPHEERTKRLKLYGEIRGFIEKAGAKVEVNDNRQNNIMVIKDCGNNDEWEVALAKQQEALIDVGSD